MSEPKSRWLRDLVVIPMVVGLVLAVITFVLPALFEKENELTYIVEAPSVYFDKDTVGSLKVQINGIKTESLVAYKARFWNSGDMPLENLAVRYVFDGFSPSDPNFNVFAVSHETQPKYEFGKIEEDASDAKSKRFKYALLNPGDMVTVTFLSNAMGNYVLTRKSNRTLRQTTAIGQRRYEDGLDDKRYNRYRSLDVVCRDGVLKQTSDGLLYS